VSRPQIAVVGSVDETRQFDPPVTDPAAARLACEELGQELAQAGWDLIVYSGKPAFVEADVVRGYLRADKTLPGSIHVRAPLGKGGFGEFSAHGEAFDIQPDPSGDWEVSFYRSLPSADGVLLVGGGRSTLVTGLIALTLRIPIIAAATFGGNAQKVWERLWNENNDATQEDVAAMAAGWQEGAATLLVRSAVAQRDAREHRARDEERRARWESRRTRIGLAVVVALLLLAVAGLAVAWGSQLGTGPGIALLVLLPTLTGAAGALIRTVLDAGRDWTRAAVLGAAAGLITGLLYVASQLIGAPDVLDAAAGAGVRRLLFFVLPIGFVAGLTFDAIYPKLRGTDVSQTQTLAAMTTVHDREEEQK